MTVQRTERIILKVVRGGYVISPPINRNQVHRTQQSRHGGHAWVMNGLLKRYQFLLTVAAGELVLVCSRLTNKDGRMDGSSMINSVLMPLLNAC